MPDPTPTQREAIQMLDRNLLVSAGAGSGKTTVLVNRFLRMVAGDADPTAPAEPTAPVDGVLTITFTDKAAGEMRERIAAALAARGLVEERRRLEVAHISTIHGFCRRLLQENPFEAGLDPRFATIEG
ncbi:MAG TPA: UvrD-helicase domain-containing protein, partial [Armatimonadota bacterium]|nr:UvrD-helicase domain-containing protein [Armatimonadota bacterium]